MIMKILDSFYLPKNKSFEIQNMTWTMEIIRHDRRNTKFRAAILDFDGTVSLIREGWQMVMIPYFTEILCEAPGTQSHEEAKVTVRDFVDILTGKQTIYQCMKLAEEVQARGGTPLPPLEYKHEYHRRLMQRIEGRIERLRNKELAPEEMMVPGSIELLKMLKSHEVNLFLASGTDEKYVFDEASLLGVSGYFNGGIFGAQDDYKRFSKAMVIQDIIEKGNINGEELVGFGDGYVEIENVKTVGGLAVGVATNESERAGIDEWKRGRLIGAGADVIIPDYTNIPQLEKYLFP